MPKTSKITFNVNDLQREHTGQKRRYDNVGLARLINATGLLQRTNIARYLWLGGSGASNTIAGSMDNVEMTIYT